MKYIFASSNKNKYNEIKAIFPYTLYHHPCDLEEIQGTLEEITLKKAKDAYYILKKQTNEDFMVIIDDVSLEIKDLNKFPGPYIKHFMEIGMINIIKMLANIEKESTVFCGIGIAYFSKESGDVLHKCIVGKCDGYIVLNNIKSDNDGFGFDPIFKPIGLTKTFGQMNIHEKILHSHRGMAVRKLLEYIKSLEKNKLIQN